MWAKKTRSPQVEYGILALLVWRARAGRYPWELLSMLYSILILFKDEQTLGAFFEALKIRGLWDQFCRFQLGP
jgi:hypothetical protein